MFSKEGKSGFMVQILNLDYTLLPYYDDEPESLCLALPYSAWNYYSGVQVAIKIIFKFWKQIRIGLNLRFT